MNELDIKGAMPKKTEILFEKIVLQKKINQ